MAKAKFVVNQVALEVDKLGDLKAEIAFLQEEHDKLERKLRRRKIGKILGWRFTLTVFEGSNKTFNHAKAKRLMGEQAYSKCWKENLFRSSRVTKLKAD